MLKKFLLVLSILAIPVYANDLPVPSRTTQAPAKQEIKQPKPKKVDMDINNLTDYFNYLPNQVHNNWIPYKSNADYEVLVQFKIMKDGTVVSPQIVKSTNKNANSSVLNAVKHGAPYKPLPKSYAFDGVTAQVQLEYKAVGGVN